MLLETGGWEVFVWQWQESSMKLCPADVQQATWWVTDSDHAAKQITAESIEGIAWFLLLKKQQGFFL